MMNFTLKSAFLALFISAFGNSICNAQVGIGTVTPVGALDVTSTNEGLLIPRIALSATNVATVLTPTISELVYNTFTSALGPNQVAPGYYYWNGSLWVPISTGNLSGWSLLGNAGTVVGTNFIGTTDDQDLVFKRNNVVSGQLNNALGNASFGVGSLPVTTTGFSNTAMGAVALSLNATGGDNTAIGNSVLMNNTDASFNTAVGSGAMTTNTTGDNNTATGFLALYSNTTGFNNVAVGRSALPSNTTGNDNIAIGTLALFANTLGVSNTAVGNSALHSNTGMQNTAFGKYALNELTTGSNNVGLGFEAGESLTTGSNNIAIGQTTSLPSNTASNQLNIGNAIFGTGLSGTLVAPAGNIGIGTATPAAKLDVAAGVTTTNSIVNATGSFNDFLQFNVQNTSTGTQAQSGYSATADNGTATTGFAWMGINNSAFNFPTAYNIGGANDVSYIGSGQDMYIANANNTKSIIFSTGKAATPFFDERMRILNDGGVAVNNSTPAAGDLFTSTSSATNTFAINGYSANEGSGVFGSISSGTTLFGAVQGEYSGSVSGGTGTRGITFSTGAGTTLADSNSGVDGQLDNGTNIFSFGIKGECNSNTGNQVGGVIGISFGGVGYGMLGYRRSTGVVYSVLGNIAYQNSTFKSSQNSEVSSSSIGIGINGGFLGGHIKGNQYGLITKGSRFGSYTDGTTITNKAYAVVNESKTGEKIATYAATSTTIDLSTKGIGNLVNGTATIMFDKNFSSLVSKGKPTIVTVSPMGETNGVYVSSVTENGFTIKENKGGSSTISFYWIAVGEKDIAKQAEVPAEVLAKDFDKNLDDVLNIDEDSKSIANAMWWNGRSLEFGKTPPAIPNQNQTKANSKK